MGWCRFSWACFDFFCLLFSWVSSLSQLISQVDFQDVNARTLAERKREEEKQRRLDRIYRERSEQAVREMEGESPGPGRG